MGACGIISFWVSSPWGESLGKTPNFHALDAAASGKGAAVSKAIRFPFLLFLVECCGGSMCGGRVADSCRDKKGVDFQRRQDAIGSQRHHSILRGFSFEKNEGFLWLQGFFEGDSFG